MANGTDKGPKLPNGDYRSRRNDKPRVHSPDGVRVRHDRRAATMPKLTGKYRDGTRKPGSRNPRKVGR